MTLSSARVSQKQGYSIYQIGLHWLIAALVFAQLIFDENMMEFVE